MNDTERRLAADLLLRAYETREPIDPLVESFDGMNLDDAYEIQTMQVTAWLEAGRVVRGHKVGLTSAVMQRMMNVDQPDYGHLVDGMFFDEFATIPTNRFLQPRVEPEIAFVLGAPLRGPGVTAADALRAVDLVLPSLELIDSRIRDWRISLLDTIADNASSGGVILGGRATRVDAFDLRLLGCNVERNGEIVATGAGGAALGNPVVALGWIANVLGERGQTLDEGHVVLPGSCTAAIPVAPGDTVTATFAGIGSVTATFG